MRIVPKVPIVAIRMENWSYYYYFYYYNHHTDTNTNDKPVDLLDRRAPLPRRPQPKYATYVFCPIRYLRVYFKYFRIVSIRKQAHCKNNKISSGSPGPRGVLARGDGTLALHGDGQIVAHETALAEQQMVSECVHVPYTETGRIFTPCRTIFYYDIVCEREARETTKMSNYYRRARTGGDFYYDVQ